MDRQSFLIIWFSAKSWDDGMVLSRSEVPWVWGPRKSFSSFNSYTLKLPQKWVCQRSFGPAFGSYGVHGTHNTCKLCDVAKNRDDERVWVPRYLTTRHLSWHVSGSETNIFRPNVRIWNKKSRFWCNSPTIKAPVTTLDPIHADFKLRWGLTVFGGICSSIKIV